MRATEELFKVKNGQWDLGIYVCMLIMTFCCSNFKHWNYVKQCSKLLCLLVYWAKNENRDLVCPYQTQHGMKNIIINPFIQHSCESHMMVSLSSDQCYAAGQSLWACSFWPIPRDIIFLQINLEKLFLFYNPQCEQFTCSTTCTSFSKKKKKKKITCTFNYIVSLIAM